MLVNPVNMANRYTIIAVRYRHHHGQGVVKEHIFLPDDRTVAPPDRGQDILDDFRKGIIRRHAGKHLVSITCVSGDLTSQIYRHVIPPSFQSAISWMTRASILPGRE